MTDGPFKYTDLSARWKTYGEYIDNEAFDSGARVEQAQKALMEDLVPAEFKAVVRDIQKQLDNLQSQLFPQLKVEAVVDKHNACEQSETLRKHILANLREKMDVGAAFHSALTSTFESGIAQANLRLIVHCIEVDEKRDRKGKMSELRSNHARTFAGIQPGYFTNSVLGKPIAVTTSPISRILDGPAL